MSTKEKEALREEERNRLGNMYTATVAFLRERFVRFLQLLKNMDQKKKTQLTLMLTEIYTFLQRRLDYNHTLREMIQTTYTDFNPQTHYIRLELDKKGRVKSRTPIAITDCPLSLRYVRHMWHILTIHERLCKRWMTSIELYADELFDLTGTAIIHQMEDFSKGVGVHAIDPDTADAMSAELWSSDGE